MKKSRIQHRGVRIGDMRHRVFIQVRKIVSPGFDGIDFGETFESTPAWAGIKTSRGKTIFDGMARDVNITHEVFIRKVDGIESGTFIQHTDGRRFRVIDFEDYDERGEYMVLMCNDRGNTEASKA